MTIIRATTALWASTDPTLRSGEEGLDTDTGRFKIGNGSTPWTTLPYAAINSASIHTASSKATPVDADELSLIDSAASFGEARLTIANLKALIAAYIVNSAPGALDTLDELAAALGDDANFADRD